MGGISEIAYEPTEAFVDEERLPKSLFIFSLTNFVAFPGMVLPIVIPKGPVLKTLQEAQTKTEFIGLVSKRNPEKELVLPQDLFSMGVCGRVLRILKLPNNSVSAVIQTLKRFSISHYERTTPYLLAQVDYKDDVVFDTKRLAALNHSAEKLLHEIMQLSPTLNEEFALAALNMDNPGQLADFIAAHIKRIDLVSRQGLLETLDVEKRLEQCSLFLTQENEILKLGHKIQNEIREKVETSQKEFYLREQLKAIKRELGEAADEKTAEIEKLRSKISEAKIPAEAETKALEELNRLSTMNIESGEYQVSRTYLDWLVALPWTKSTIDRLSLPKARLILEKDHFGLAEIKERILEFLAVKKLKKDAGGSILCFVGPPGTGKTSLGRSIAEALGRKYIRVSLGGMRDEAEIKGHRRTYIGAMPGRIIQCIKQVQTNNPVFILDEIDKLGADFRGDPASALLEVLDPEQNTTFGDHYLNVPFDLSRVMFICTANSTAPIPAALHDRMEVIQLSGYIEEEKIQIARRHLLPKQLKAHGLTSKALSIPVATLQSIVRNYTREAGVRSFERELANLCRKIAKRIASGRHAKVQVKARTLEHFLGTPKFSDDTRLELKPGVAIGLAYTPYGGEILFVEVTKMKGKQSLILTGQLGDVIQESARIAVSTIRSHAVQYGVGSKDFETCDLHIHFPANAVPKDGPSAGITIATALLSLLRNQKIRSKIAMTGEISLIGQVLPIGGLKEKIIAAKAAGIQTIIIPKDNRKDLREIPKHVLKGLTFKPVATFDEVVRLVF